MNSSDISQSTSAADFEREKWNAECQFREREVAVKEREQDSKAGELLLKQAEQAASHWKNPLVVAILAAAVAGVGNATVAYLNGDAQTLLETQKSEQARILEMIKTGSPDKAAENLLVSKLEGATLKPYKEAGGAMVIGSSHLLTEEELKSGQLFNRRHARGLPTWNYA